MVEREAQVLRREIERHGAARGKRYDKRLQERVIAYAGERRRAGAAWLAIATELGMKFETIRRWCVQGEPQSSAASPLALRRVEVMERDDSRSLAVISPAGFRVEGLTLQSAVLMLRALG
jgi:hypothetical protein